MAGTVSLEDTFSEEDFQKILALIGGKERIHLVSDVSPSPEEAEDEAGILQDFIRDMFDSSLWNKAPSCPPEDGHQTGAVHVTVRPAGVDGRAPKDPQRTRTAATRTDVSSRSRTIDCPVIIFMFTQTFLLNMSNQTCLKEILKDVKARTKRARLPQPALVGLIGTAAESAETHRCAQTLEHLMKTVFSRQSAQTMWVSWFSPGTQDTVRSIKMNMSRVIHASETADNTRDKRNLLLWPFRCLFWSHRGRPRRHVNKSTTSWQTGDTRCTEEGIPLKTNSLYTEPHVDGASAR